MTTWQFLWRLCTYRPWHYLANILLWGAFHLLPLLVALLTRSVFDALTGSAPMGWNAWTFLLLLALVTLGRTGVFILGFKAFSSYYLMVQALINRNMMEYLLKAAGARMLPESPSEAVTRFRDDTEDIAKYVEHWMDLGGFVLYGLSAMAYLVSIDPMITLVACGPMFAMTLLMRRLAPLIRQYRRLFREKTALVTGFIGETFASVQAVQVSGKEEHMAAHFAKLGEERRKAALRDTLLTELIHTANQNLVNIGVGVVLLLAAGEMRSGQFTVGDFALYIAVLPRLTRILTFTGNVMAQHKRSRVAFDRLVYLLQDAPPETLVASRPLYLYGDLPSEQELDQRGREPWHASQDRANHAVKVGAERSKPAESRDAYGSLEALEVRNLTFHYPGSRTGIEGISFTVRRGEFVVVTGRVGSGKTTLVRVLLGLLPMESGEILWNGRPVQDPASFFVPPRSAYTPQVPRLLSETLRENILLGNAGGAQIDSAADISRERALENALEKALEKALDLAVLRDDIAGLERGLDTLVGNRGVKLSGGQVQRAAAARMFVREAELMVFDDLSSALDVQTEQSLWTSLFAEREATCLVVSHRPVALWRATRVIVLDEGRLVATGTPEELAAENLLLVDRGEKGINGISGV